jgi:hypothetical protein
VQLVVGEHGEVERDAPEFGLALEVFGAEQRRRECWDEHAEQDRDDGNTDQRFDERETGATRRRRREPGAAMSDLTFQGSTLPSPRESSSGTDSYCRRGDACLQAEIAAGERKVSPSLIEFVSWLKTAILAITPGDNIPTLRQGSTRAIETREGALEP